MIVSFACTSYVFPRTISICFGSIAVGSVGPSPSPGSSGSVGSDVSSLFSFNPSTVLIDYQMSYRPLPQGYVFTGIKNNPGYPYYIKKIQDRKRRILKFANLSTGLTPQSLRHTHTSLIAQAGVISN